MTAVIDSPNESTRGWVVDVATHRIMRKGVSTAARQDGGDKVSTNELNPLEDVKGAAKLLKDVHPVRAMKEALEKGAELIDPVEADIRAMEIDEDSRNETPAAGPMDSRRPADVHAHPDTRELGREHPRL